MMKKAILILGIAIVLLWCNVSQATTLILEGPILTGDIGDWPSAGLQIKALENVTLESFIFQNQGNPDTIQLKNNVWTTLYEYSYGGSDPSHYIDVSWELLAGQTYHLIATHPSNGKYAYYPSFPEGNDHIQVEGVKYGGYLYNYWFHFNDLTTTNLIPEPATMSLLGMGLISLVGLRNKQTRSSKERNA